MSWTCARCRFEHYFTNPFNCTNCGAPAEIRENAEVNLREQIAILKAQLSDSREIREALVKEACYWRSEAIKASQRLCVLAIENDNLKSDRDYWKQNALRMEESLRESDIGRLKCQEIAKMHEDAKKANGMEGP